MQTHTAHRKAEFQRDDDGGAGFVFVKDGFSWPAFLIPFIWLVWHRMWLALVGYVVAVVALAGTGYLVGFPDSLSFWLGLLLNLFMGLEGNNFRRRSLERRGYQEVADVVGDDREEAAWRFFADRTPAQGN